MHEGAPFPVSTVPAVLGPGPLMRGGNAGRPIHRRDAWCSGEGCQRARFAGMDVIVDPRLDSGQPFMLVSPGDPMYLRDL